MARTVACVRAGEADPHLYLRIKPPGSAMWERQDAARADRAADPALLPAQFEVGYEELSEFILESLAERESGDLDDQ